MFDLSWMELLFCTVLGLIVVGPKDLPKLMRSIGSVVKPMKSVNRDTILRAQQIRPCQ